MNEPTLYETLELAREIISQHRTDPQFTEAHKRRMLAVLDAVCGYMTECGTTTEQNALLRALGMMD